MRALTVGPKEPRNPAVGSHVTAMRPDLLRRRLALATGQEAQQVEACLKPALVGFTVGLGFACFRVNVPGIYREFLSSRGTRLIRGNYESGVNIRLSFCLFGPR